MSSKNIFILFLVLLSSQILCQQTLNPLSLNKHEYSSLDAGQYKFFNLTLGESEVLVDEEYLYLRVQSNDALDRLEGIISDPNLYISEKNNFPKNRNDSTYFSETSGEEIVTISRKFMVDHKTLFIGIGCEKRCNFILFAQKALNIESKVNDMTPYILKPEDYIRIKINPPKTSYHTSFITAVGLGLSPFRLYVNKDYAASYASLASLPISYNGYRVEIEKSMQSSEPYYALIQNYGKQNLILFSYRVDDEELNLLDSQKFDDTMESKDVRCFKYLIEAENYYKDLVINAQVNEGSGSIVVGGWENPKKQPEKARMYEFTSSRIFQITSDELKRFGEIKDKKETYFHFCVYPKGNLNYQIQIYLLNSSYKFNDLNLIFPGQDLNYILPKRGTTKYTLIQYNTKYPIQFKMNSQNPNTKLFAFFCDIRNCKVDDNFIKDQTWNPKTYLMNSTKIAGIQQITIPPEKNICLQGLDHSLERCVVISVVMCDDPSNVCNYNLAISQKFTQNQLRQKQPIYSYLSAGKEETYDFTITEPKTFSIYVVFNQQSGDAKITVYKYKSDYSKDVRQIFDEEITEEEKVMNQYYLPHVIKIDRTKTEGRPLEGKYYISIKANTFSTFNIYFYSFLSEGDNPDLTRHTFDAMRLDRGHILEDFIYGSQMARLYSYENNMIMEDEKNIIISFIPLSSNCKAYVFNDVNDIRFENEEDSVKVKGFFWESGSQNQIIIKTTDSEYKRNGIYYILIVDENTLNHEEDYSFAEYSSFSVAVFEEGDGLILSESTEHRLSLTDNNKEQIYYYIHSDMSKKFLVTVNLFRGNVGLEMTVNEKHKVLNTKILFYTDPSFFYEIDEKTLKKYCPDALYCPIEIKLTRETFYGADYLIVCKSGEEKEEKLSSGVSREAQILIGESHKYSVELKPDKRMGARINLRSISGTVDAYAKIERRMEDTSESKYPTQNDYEYKSIEIAYRIQSIDIPYEDLKEFNTVRILIVVIGNTSSSKANMIKYDISYSSTSKRIEINTLYNFIIHQGETQFYSFEINDDTQNRIYISMSDKQGDADMYLNFGTKFPSFKNYNWKSTGAYTETIDISSKDPYFVRTHDESITGPYSLMIYGYSNATYTLYVSNSKIKLIQITDGNTASCSCQEDNDSCYFKYEVYNSFDIKKLYSKELIFTVDYTYGGGNVYSKLYKSGNSEEILKDLPTEKNFDWKSQKDSYIEIYLNQLQEKITKDSQLVLNVKCSSKSLFDFNAVRVIDEENPMEFLYLGKNNIFSLKSGGEKEIEVSMSKGVDINYEIKVLKGKISVTVIYGENETLAESYSFDVSDSDRTSYLNRIEVMKCKSLYATFKIKIPSSIGNSIFFIKAEYDEEWIRVPIGPSLSYTFKNKFNGYFDFLDEYDSVMVNIKSASNDQRKIKVYAKLNLYIADDINEYTYKYSIPSENNYDHFTESNEFLPFASFTVDNLPLKLREELDDARLLFSVEYETFSLAGNNKIEITLTPDVGHFKKFTPKQGSYYLSSFNLTENKTDNTQVFNLERRSVDDDLMVIEISSCHGFFGFQVSNTLIFNNNYKVPVYPTTENNYLGKSIITLDPIPDDADKFYLYLWSSSDNIRLFGTEKNPEFLVYYYTTNKNNYNFVTSSSTFNYTLDSETSLTLTLPKFIERDIFGNDRNITDLEAKLITTQNISDIHNFGSVCFLSKIAEKKKEDYEFNYIKYELNKESFKMKVSNLKKGERYYFNVLIKNLKTGDLYSFNPIDVNLAKPIIKIYHWGIVALCSLIIIVLGCTAFTFYKKYKQTHMVLKYEETDIRNMASIPKTAEQIGNIELTQKKEKYSGLTEEVSN